MANKLYIAEFVQGVSGIGTTWAQFPPQPSIANQIATIGSAASAAFNDKTRCVMLVADTTCVIKFSTAGTAPDNTKDLLLPANVPVMFGVNGGDKVAAGAP